MNRARALAAALVIGLVFASVPLTGLGAEEAGASRTVGPPVGERVFALTMEGHEFNGETWPDTPLLEAYAGEQLTFTVLVPPGAEMHTFHLHGHPWEDPRSGDTIDTVLLRPGGVHAFRVTAGLEEGHSGDWLYHCHVGSHFEEGMWGLLRVYPYAVSVDGPLDALEIQLDQEGNGLEDAHFDAVLREQAGDPSAEEAFEGEPVELDVEPRGDGAYRVSPQLPAGADGELVLRAHHEEGESLARLALDAANGYTLNRDVGVDAGVPSTPELSGVPLASPDM